MKEENTAKAYLMSVRAADLHLKVLEDELKRYQAELTAPRAAAYMADKVSGGTPFTMSEQVERIVDLQRNLAAEWNALIRLRTEAREMIMSLDNKIYSAVLMGRYIDCMSWNAIAGRLNYGRSWLMQTHTKALQMFDVIYRKQKNVQKCTSHL